MILLRPPGHAHETNLKIRLLFQDPDLVALRGLYDSRRTILEFSWKTPLEGVRGFHQVIIHGDEGVLDVSRRRIRKQGASNGTLDPELDDFDHD